jgi:hypothetical protein
MDLAPGMSRVGLTLAGLLVLLTFCSAPQPMKQQIKAAASESTGRAQDTLSRFTKLSRYGDDGSEIESIGDGQCRLLPIASAELLEAFPQVRFYQYIPARILQWDHRYEPPPSRYMIAVTGDTFYLMPMEFNRLLFATGQLLTDSNIVTMAKAYVMFAAIIFAERDTADPFGIPPITMLDAKKLDRATVDGIGPYDVYVKAAVDQEVQERYLDQRYRQFRSMYLANPDFEKDMQEQDGLCGTITVLGSIPDFLFLVDPNSGKMLPEFPGSQ